MDQYRRLAGPAYLVAFMLIFIPLFDASMQLWPWRPGLNQWRFGALGLMSNALMIPSVGLLVALVTGRTFGHRTLLRIMGWLSAAAAVLATVMLLSFVLDAVETRLRVTEAGRLSFLVASFTAAAKMVLSITMFFLVARAGIGTSPRRSGGRGSGDRQPTLIPMTGRAAAGGDAKS